MLVFQLVSSRSRNGGSSARWSRKKKSALGSLVRRTCGAARWANSASATRSRRQPSTSANVRIHATERCHRSGATSVTRIDVDPSCSTTKSTPAVSVTDTSACGRASATITSAAATLTASQNESPPANRYRSRTGAVRDERSRPTSRRRRASCQSQIGSSRTGPASSHRNSGSMKRTGGIVSALSSLLRRRGRPRHSLHADSYPRFRIRSPAPRVGDSSISGSTSRCTGT